MTIPIPQERLDEAARLADDLPKPARWEFHNIDVEVKITTGRTTPDDVTYARANFRARDRKGRLTVTRSIGVYVRAVDIDAAVEALLAKLRRGDEVPWRRRR